MVNALKEMIPPKISDNIKATIFEILSDENFKADAASKYVCRIISIGQAASTTSSVKYVALVGLGE